MPVLYAMGKISAATGGALGIDAWENAGNSIAEHSPTGMLLKKPELPQVIVPDPLPEKGDEGIRSGETARIARKRTLGQLYLTRGQNRSDPSTLGGIKQQLG